MSDNQGTIMIRTTQEKQEILNSGKVRLPRGMDSKRVKNHHYIVCCTNTTEKGFLVVKIEGDIEHNKGEEYLNFSSYALLDRPNLWNEVSSRSRRRFTYWPDLGDLNLTLDWNAQINSQPFTPRELPPSLAGRVAELKRKVAHEAIDKLIDDSKLDDLLRAMEPLLNPHKA